MLKNLIDWAFNKGSTEPSVRDAIEELIEEDKEEGQTLAPQERILLTNILKLRDLTAEDVMTPRVDIKAIPLNLPYEELVNNVASINHTRVPVYRGTLDEVIGFINSKDVLSCAPGEENFNYRAIMKEAMFISPSMRLLDLLLQMKISKVPIAFVVDEFGGVDGIVTSWDIIQEILGSLGETHNAAEEITRLSDHSAIVDARLPVEQFEQEFHIKLSEEEKDDVDTVGGLIFAIIGRVPNVGETIEYTSGISFEILEADERSLKKIRIYQLSRNIDPEDKDEELFESE